MTEKVEQMETKSLEISGNADERLILTDQRLEKVSEMGMKLMEKLTDASLKITEKIDSEIGIAKKEREYLFTNTNQARQSLMGEITRISGLMVQKLGMTIQEEGKKAHGTMQLIGKLLNEKFGQKLKGLEQTVIEKIET
jgi:hypothetical protein